MDTTGYQKCFGNICHKLGLHDAIFIFPQGTLGHFLNLKAMRSESTTFKVHMHRIFDNFLYEKWSKTKIYSLLMSVSVPEIYWRHLESFSDFQSLRNLEKKCDKEIEHFVPL